MWDSDVGDDDLIDKFTIPNVLEEINFEGPQVLMGVSGIGGTLTLTLLNLTSTTSHSSVAQQSSSTFTHSEGKFSFRIVQYCRHNFILNNMYIWYSN